MAEEEKGNKLDSIEKQLEAKETELNNLKLEIKSKIKFLETLNLLGNPNHESTLLSKLQTQEEELVVCDKQINSLKQTIDALNATRVDPRVVKERDEKIVQLKEHAEVLESENKGLKEQIEQANVNLLKMQQNFQIEERKKVDELESLKNTLNQLNGANTSLQEELSNVINIRERYREKKKKYKSEKKELEGKINELLTKHSEAPADHEQTGNHHSEKNLLKELEDHMQQVSNLNRANVNLQEELETIVKKWKKAHGKQKNYKKAMKEAQEKLQEHTEKPDQSDGQQSNLHKFMSYKFGTTAPVGEKEKLLQKLHNDNLKKKKYKALVKEWEQKYHEEIINAQESQKNKTLITQYDNESQSIIQITEKLEKIQAELTSLEEKYKKSKNKTKNYKAEHKKWREKYKKIPKKHRDPLSDGEKSDPENPESQQKQHNHELPHDWEKLEAGYKHQISELKEILHTKQTEIEQLQKSLKLQSARKEASDKFENLKMLLAEANAINKDYEDSLAEKDEIIKDLEDNIQKYEAMNKELEQHLEDVEEKIEQANTQILEMQEQLHEKQQNITNLASSNEFLEQKLKLTNSRLKVMADTLSIKEDDLRKKDEFGNRLVEELDKMKKKLNAANSKIQHTLKDQIAEAEKKVKEKDIEVKILKDMTQSMKTMLKGKEAEIARLKQKNHHLELHPVNSGAEPSERYPETHYTRPVFRVHNRSLDARRARNFINMSARKDVDSHDREEPGEGGPEYSFLQEASRILEERNIIGLRKPGFLPAIDSATKDTSFTSQKLENIESPNTNIKNAKITKGQDLRNILDQTNEERATPTKLSKVHNRSRHIFDPSNEPETRTQESDMHISPVKVTQRKKGNS